MEANAGSDAMVGECPQAPQNAPRLPVLVIVVPCYNEEAVLPRTLPLLLDELERLVACGSVSPGSRLLFVDDGSDDSTWRIIDEAAARDERIMGVSLSRNCGFQNALMAGLLEARRCCDICISIDADGQDDERAMEGMVEAYAQGAQVVYGVRSSRASDGVFKRATAQGFYRFMAAMGAKTVYNHADYRLLSHRVLDELASYTEANLYLRGLIPLLGFSSATVSYERRPRLAGKSHYSVPAMATLALDGITSLTVKPIHLIAVAGGILSIASVFFIIWAIVVSCMGHAVPGWASLVCIISLIGGLQLFALGLIGEYVGRIYLEVKHRPRYIVERRVGVPPRAVQEGRPADEGESTGATR
ncbi:glycosyltransferase family 2 protein [Collinsella sp. An2]|uniref:glycosyltransferase family 2 protein n=1 Tax=Collinsella sp. An2 TaxID=1965585 RepID=UPI001EF4A5C7|nr:glycosyltransferase family 2 protein [Collinsella sp. An2]